MASLPSYVAAAQPIPQDKRVPWFKTTAQTYAGVMLWFVFWDSVPTIAPTPATPGGLLAQGLGLAILGVVVAALLCHFLFYLARDAGNEDGHVAGCSRHFHLRREGRILHAGLLHGRLAVRLVGGQRVLRLPGRGRVLRRQKGTSLHLVIGTAWTIVAAFVGLKGIHYVAKVATFLPLIPLVILLVL